MSEQGKVFDQEQFNEFIIESRVVGFFDEEVTLKSGRKSHWYINWRRVTSDVYLSERLSDFILDYFDQNTLGPDCVFGVPEGATKTAILVNFRFAQQSHDYAPYSHALPMGRAKPKLHGDPKDRIFVGAPRGKTMVLEDVTTTGGSLLKTIDNLISMKIEIHSVLSLTHRMERTDSGESFEELLLRKYGGKIPHFTMSTAQSLLPLAVKKLKPPDEVLRKIEEEYKQYGECPIHFS